jgi:hypothetical protein
MDIMWFLYEAEVVDLKAFLQKLVIKLAWQPIQQLENKRKAPILLL